jgi:hypothetical protein
MQRRRATRNIILFIVIAFAVLIFIDRYYWAQIAQWREDQAANIWLGYTSGLGHIPVGLISSKYIPNPNGMILLGSLLSILPNLVTVSLFLGLAQALLLILVGWKASAGSWQYFALAAFPALSSVILRSSSVEFWNQYTITLVNVFFLFWALCYLEKPSLWNFPPIAILILLAPSLYLAGVVNAIVMILLSLGMVLYKRPDWKQVGIVSAVMVSILAVSILVTWRPYFQSVSLGQLADINKNHLGPVATFRTFWESLFGIPIYGTFQWADQAVFAKAFKHADEAILSQPAKILLRLVGRAYLLQAVFAFATALYTIYRTVLYGVPRSDNNRPAVNVPALQLVVLSVLFISLSFSISTWMGGPNWLNGERPDQIVQFLPMFLFFIFLLPVLIRLGGRAGRAITAISYFLLALFVTVNLLCGFMIVHDHLQYRGNILTEADVPLVDKEQAIRYIAQDWSRSSTSQTISIDYDIDRGIWDGVSSTEPAVLLNKWYPASLTEGRGFDYEMLRRYGLKNQQEGIQLRTFGSGRYLVTYAFENPPQVNAANVTEHVFGRLRVTTVEK